MQCLDRRRVALREAIELLGSIDRATVPRALPIAVGLPAIDACADRATMLDTPARPSDPAVRAELDAIAAQLDRGHAERDAGHLEAARLRYSGAVQRATRAAWSPLEAEAWLALGDLQFTMGNIPSSDASLSQAIDAASRGRDDRAVADGLISLVTLVGFRHAQLGEVDRLTRLADAAVVRAGDDREQRARLHHALAVVYYLREDWPNARAHWEQALAIWRGLPGDHAEEIGGVLTQLAGIKVTDGKHREALADLASARKLLGTTMTIAEQVSLHMVSCVAHRQLGELDQARAECDAARTLVVEAGGPDHPDAGTVESTLGDVVWRQRGAEALPYFERGAAILTRALGAGHPQTILARENLARILRELGKLDEAEAILTETLASAEATHGKDHVRVGVLHRDRAEVLLLRGKLVEAADELAVAVELVGRGRGADHLDTAMMEHRYGDVLAQLGRYEQARVQLVRALPIRERVLGANNGDVGITLNVLGGVEVQLGDYASGIAHLERARQIIEATQGSSNLALANSLNSLGEAYRLTGRIEDATAAYERAHTMLVAVVGPNHADVGVAVFNLGEVAMAGRKYQDALARYDEAMAIWARRANTPELMIGYGLTGRGEALTALGRGHEAIDALERALPIRVRARDPVALAQTEIALAEALLANHRDVARARSLAAAAATRIEGAGPRVTGLLARLKKLRAR